MPNPNTFDDTTADHERFESELVAQDQDAARIATADLDEQTAHHLVCDLIDEDLIIPIPASRVLVHDPSGEAFESITQLAVFHRGWTAARSTDAEDD